MAFIPGAFWLLLLLFICLYFLIFLFSITVYGQHYSASALDTQHKKISGPPDVLSSYLTPYSYHSIIDCISYAVMDISVTIL